MICSRNTDLVELEHYIGNITNLLVVTWDGQDNHGPIYTAKFGERRHLQLIGDSSTVGHATNQLMFPNTQYGLNRKTLILTVIEWRTFIIKEFKGDSYIYSGYYLGYLDIIAKKLNFRYGLHLMD